MQDSPPTGLLARYYRPPFIGIIAFAGVFLAAPLGHTFTVIVRTTLPASWNAWVYIFVGAVALVLLAIGVKRNDEISGTLLGFASGLLMWIGWASYAFRFNSISLGLPPIDIGAAAARPADLFYLQGSIGICITTLMFFVFSKETKCNAFRWIQRALRLNVGEPEMAQGRNIARITFLETVYVIWFCYAVSLFFGDPRYLGLHHPATYTIVGGLLVWGLYLFWRLMKFTRVMAAVRYAIPVKSILWLPLGEFAPSWGIYGDFWMRPAEYSVTMWTAVAVFVAVLLASGFLPQRRLTGTAAG